VSEWNYQNKIKVDITIRRDGKVVISFLFRLIYFMMELRCSWLLP
jgi:hypothetical protein